VEKNRLKFLKHLAQIKQNSLSNMLTDIDNNTWHRQQSKASRRRVEHVNYTASAYSSSHHVSSHNTDTSSPHTKTLSIMPVVFTQLSKQHNTPWLVYCLIH